MRREEASRGIRPFLLPLLLRHRPLPGWTGSPCRRRPLAGAAGLHEGTAFAINR